MSTDNFNISKPLTAKPRSAKKTQDLSYQKIHKASPIFPSSKSQRKNNSQSMSQSLKPESPIKEISEDDAIQKIEALRSKLRVQLLELLETEQKKEAIREEKLKKAVTNEERENLEKKYGIERAEASDKIISLQK